MAHLPDPNTTGPDQALVSLLNKGVDAGFEKARSKALETLESEDILAVWLQATGDGTQLDSTPRDAPSPRTTPHISHLAGFDDDLEFPQVSQLARHLFGHHLGVLTNANVPTISSRDALHQLGTDVCQLADELSKASGAAPVDYSIRAPLSTRLDQAADLLSDSDLTVFWLQVLTSDGTIRTAISTNGGEQPYPPTDIDSTTEAPIAYVMGVPEGLYPSNQTVILSQLFAQHALVGAHTADIDIKTFCEDSLSMALEAGYHREVMDDI